MAGRHSQICTDRVIDQIRPVLVIHPNTEGAFRILRSGLSARDSSSQPLQRIRMCYRENRTGNDGLCPRVLAFSTRQSFGHFQSLCITYTLAPTAVQHCALFTLNLRILPSGLLRLLPVFSFETNRTQGRPLRKNSGATTNRLGPRLPQQDRMRS